jgi:predicted ferric reductase
MTSPPAASASAVPGARTGRRALWFVVFTLVVLAPVALTYVGELGPPGPPGVEAGIFLGFLAMAVLCGQFATTGRFQRLARPVGQSTMMKFHRVTGIAALGLVLLHPVLLLWFEPAYLDFLDPRANRPRAAALMLVVLATLGVVGVSLFRRRLGLSYEWWRLWHGALAGLVILIGIVHINQVAYYAGTPWKRGLWTALAGVALGLLVDTRLVRPWRLRRRPWRVTQVRTEQERVWTLVLEPEGHAGLAFATGQHVWLTLGDSPFSLQQHPFTIASADTQPARIELTIKALGDFTSTIGQVQLGQRAFLEGPYGASWLYAAGDRPLILLAGGIGITPFASALRTLRARGMKREVVLLHGAQTLAKATFHDELSALAAELGGRYLPVLETPPAGWAGERGYLSRELLQRQLRPEQLARGLFVVCGPPAMLAHVRRELRALGVARRQIHLEDFDMV